MKTIVYSRVSTDQQSLAQQERTVHDWLKAHGMEATEIVSDEGVRGGVSYKKRKLGTEVLPKLSKGDILIVSEISRLGRSMSDINKLVCDELKPRGVRLVVVQMGLDLDCANIKAIDEMILFSFGFAAQLEKELIQERTASALDVRRRELAENGSFISKSGRKCTRLGNTKKGCAKAGTESGAVRREKARADANNKRIWGVIQSHLNGRKATLRDAEIITLDLNGRDIKTRTGKAFNVTRTRNCIRCLSKLYA